VNITASMVKQLRDKTNAGIMDCKKALYKCDNNIARAIDWLRQKELVVAKRVDCVAREGQVAAYIHTGGKLGVLVEINSETDFVGKTKEFIQFTKDIAMQIAATNPICVVEKDIPVDILRREREIFFGQAKSSGKPEKIWEKIIEGKLKKFISEIVLLKQSFIKDPDKIVEDLLNEIRVQTGENIKVRRFVRFQLGEQVL